MNKNIIKEILSDDRDLDTVVTTQSVIQALASVEGLELEKVGRLWQCRGIENSMFGEGIFDALDSDSKLLSAFIDVVSHAMWLMEREGISNPYDAILEGFLEYNPCFTLEDLYELMLNLSECESLAPWLYWCPLKPGYNT